MEQLKLTQKQQEILKRLDQAVKEAIEARIGFVYDIDDMSVNAYNASNVKSGYAGRVVEDEDDCELNFYASRLTHMVGEQRFCDYYDGCMQSYYLKSN